jgi:hypothetical protein
MAKSATVTQIKAGDTPTAKRTRAPEGETNRQRFVRVASTRLTSALDAIRLLGEMGPSNVYEFEKVDVDKIVSALNKATEEATEKLTNRKAAKAAEAASLFD